MSRIRMNRPGRVAIAVSAALAIGLLATPERFAYSQSSAAENPRISVSSIANQHLHMLGFRAADLDQAIAQLPADEAAIQFESSSGFDGGLPSGSPHSHVVNVTKRQLVQLRDSGTLTIESDVAAGHRHSFTFIRQDQCPGAVTVEASPSASPSASPQPSASATPLPSVSASVTPSASPSEPAPTPSVAPRIVGSTPTPQPPTVSPTPSPTRTVPRGLPEPRISVLPPIAPNPLPPCPTTPTPMPVPVPCSS